MLRFRSVQRRRGNALVEGALVLMPLLLVIIGILDFGQLLFQHQTFTERARAGVRWAVTHNYDTQQIKNFVLYNSPTAPEGNPRGLFGLTASEITVTRFDSGDQVKDRIEVSIHDVPMRFYSPVLSKVLAHRPFRVVRRVEALGATN